MEIESRHQLLKSLVEIPSPSGNEQIISEFCSDYLRNHGFSVEAVEIENGRKSIIAAKNPNSHKSAIAFCGHLDTVRPQLTDWDNDKPPFQLTRINDRYYGNGTADMKGGISLILEATKNIPNYIKIILTIDEEEISEGSWSVIKQRPDFFQDIKLMVAAEPLFNLPPYKITTGRTGRQIYEASFVGQAEHIMNYDLAIDAMKLMYRFGNAFYDAMESDKLFKSSNTRAQIRKSYSESLGMSVPGYAVADIEVIQGTEDSSDDIQKNLQALTKDGLIGLKPRKTPYLTSYLFHDFPGKELLENIIEQHTDHKVEYAFRSSVGDENVFATLNIPVITYGPMGGNEHRSNEFVEILSLDHTLEVYKEFLNKLESKKNNNYYDK